MSGEKLGRAGEITTLKAAAGYLFTRWRQGRLLADFGRRVEMLLFTAVSFVLRNASRKRSKRGSARRGRAGTTQGGSDPRSRWTPTGLPLHYPAATLTDHMPTSAAAPKITQRARFPTHIARSKATAVVRLYRPIDQRTSSNKPSLQAALRA
jgi:hypothetical protein